RERNLDGRSSGGIQGFLRFPEGLMRQNCLTYAYPLSIIPTMKMSRGVREQFRAFGRRGGQARSAAMTSQERRAVARHAAIRRWIKASFGSTSFESLRLPGGEFVDAGLTDLVHGRVTVESLTVSEAAPRLRREGIAIPEPVFDNAAMR